MRRLLLILVLSHLGCVPNVSPAGPTGSDPDMGTDMAANNSPNNVNNPNNIQDMRRNNLDGDVGLPDMDIRMDRARFTSIAMSNRAVCVLEDATKRTFCWGSNERNLLRDAIGEVVQLPPFERPDFPRFEQLSAGRRHMCGIVEQGVLCWGDNSHQQVRDNPNVALAAPTTVVVNLDIESVAAGRYQTCAMIAGGNGSCWGSNVWGTLDPSVNAPDCPDFGSGEACSDPTNNSSTCINGDKCFDSFSPTRIGDSMVVSLVAAGNEHNCVLDQSGRVHCWGRNDDKRAVPDAEGTGVVSDPTLASTQSFSKLKARDRTCGVVLDGSIECWGPTQVNYNPVPNVDNATDIAVGSEHACALVDDGSVWCWGTWYGAADSTPTQFVAPTGDPFLSIGAGPMATCASTAADLFCWGENAGDGLVGQFTDETPVNQAYTEPTLVLL